MDVARRLPGIKPEGVIRSFSEDSGGFVSQAAPFGCFGALTLLGLGVVALLGNNPFARCALLGIAAIAAIIQLKNVWLPLPAAVVTHESLGILHGFVVRTYWKVPWTAIQDIYHHGPCEPGDRECVAVRLKAGLGQTVPGARQPEGYQDYHFSVGSRAVAKVWWEALEKFRKEFS